MLKVFQSLVDAIVPDRCTICNKPLLGSYRVNKWGQKACVDHNLAFCTSCGRYVLPSDLCTPDGRHTCSECIGKVVRKPEHIEWVYSRVAAIFERNFLALPGKIPVEIVTAEQMQALHSTPLSGVKMSSGLTVSRGVNFFCAPMQHKVYILDYHHKVVFGGILAHELLHVWQNEHHIELPKNYCEGFCNLGSYLFYTYLDNELSQKHAQWMLESQDPIYGEGFRQVKAIFEREGGRNLEKTMEILVKKSR
ncbi:MAG: hypothetical protein IJW88_05875 [Alistipes sp.]|nr:hypothetical protein [Alistipes sp.]